MNREPDNYPVFGGTPNMSTTEITLNFFFPDHAEIEPQVAETNIDDAFRDYIEGDIEATREWDNFVRSLDSENLQDYYPYEDDDYDYKDFEEYDHEDIDVDDENEEVQWFVKTNVDPKLNPKRYKIVGVLDNDSIALTSETSQYPYFNSPQGGQVQYFKPEDFRKVFVEWKSVQTVWSEIYTNLETEGIGTDSGWKFKVKDLRRIINGYFESQNKIAPDFNFSRPYIDYGDMMSAVNSMKFGTDLYHDFHTVLSWFDEDEDDVETVVNEVRKESHYDTPLLGSKLFNTITHKVSKVVDHNVNGVVLEYDDPRFYNEKYTVFRSICNDAEYENFKSQYKVVWTPETKD